MTVGLTRRLAAICYDSMLLASVLFIATLIILPFVSHAAIESTNLVYKIYLLIISYLCLCWQWQHGGQTLGMKSWQIKVVTMDDQKPTWLQLSMRFFCALFSWLILGFGFLWSLIDKRDYALHDHLSSTKLIRVTEQTHQG